MNKIFIVLIAISAIGCGSSYTDNSAPAKWDPNVLATVSQSQCPSGQSLIEDTDLKNRTFSEMGVPNQTFGFFNGSGRCALTHPVNDNMIGWFEVKFNGNCLQNGTIWPVSIRSNRMDKSI